MSGTIQRVESFGYAGKLYSTELEAIRAAVATRIGNNVAIAKNITDSAADLLPLLQRVVELKQKG